MAVAGKGMQRQSGPEGSQRQPLAGARVRVQTRGPGSGTRTSWQPARGWSGIRKTEALLVQLRLVLVGLLLISARHVAALDPLPCPSSVDSPYKGPAVFPDYRSDDDWVSLDVSSNGQQRSPETCRAACVARGNAARDVRLHFFLHISDPRTSFEVCWCSRRGCHELRGHPLAGHPHIAATLGLLPSGPAE